MHLNPYTQFMFPQPLVNLGDAASAIARQVFSPRVQVPVANWLTMSPAIADGQYLQRSGNTIVGATISGSESAANKVLRALSFG